MCRFLANFRLICSFLFFSQGNPVDGFPTVCPFCAKKKPYQSAHWVLIFNFGTTQFILIVCKVPVLAQCVTEWLLFRSNIIIAKNLFKKDSFDLILGPQC